MKHRSSKAAAIHAIPTKYRGLQFRSRLEATWACFFDQCGWEWQYEPFDMDGWIPDFLIKEHTNILVEVKPIIARDQELEASISLTLGSNHQLLFGEEYFEPLIVGAFPFEGEDVCHKCIGWISECHTCDNDGPYCSHDCGDWWAEAPLGFWHGSEGKEKNPASKIGFCHCEGSYIDRITGCYDGDAYLSVDKKVDKLWRKSKNAVQWKRPRMR